MGKEPGYYFIGGSLGPTTGMGVEEDRKYTGPARIRT
jgi:hypothetical protein